MIEKNQFHLKQMSNYCYIRLQYQKYPSIFIKYFSLTSSKLTVTLNQNHLYLISLFFTTFHYIGSKKFTLFIFFKYTPLKYHIHLYQIQHIFIKQHHKYLLHIYITLLLLLLLFIYVFYSIMIQKEKNLSFINLLKLIQSTKTQWSPKLSNLIQQQLKSIQINQQNYIKFQDLVIRLLENQQLKSLKIPAEKIADYLINITWFQKTFKFNSKQIIKYIDHLHIKKYAEKQIIINKGAPSLEFYVIIKGSAFVIKEILKNQKKQIDQNVQLQNLSNPQLGFQITQGNHFGDVGVLFKKKRMATIIAKSNCIAIQISAYAFNIISAQVTLKLHQKRFKFICQKLSNKISSFNYQDQQQLLLAFQPCNFSFGSLIYKSKISTQFYMIQQGVVQCYRRENNKKKLSKTQNLGFGMFIGLQELLNELSVGSQNQNQETYELYARSEIVKTYSINKNFFIKFLRSHKQLMNQILNRNQYKIKNILASQRLQTKQRFLYHLNTKRLNQQQCLNARVYSKIKKLLNNTVNTSRIILKHLN